VEETQLGLISRWGRIGRSTIAFDLLVDQPGDRLLGGAEEIRVRDERPATNSEPLALTAQPPQRLEGVTYGNA
jgi:hypothetical protein